ncbi:MAG: hypothetical protein K2N11_05020 [Mucispirillum sp.]|nr:hypothetical protein [Mucispirillum sp.]
MKKLYYIIFSLFFALPAYTYVGDAYVTPDSWSNTPAKNCIVCNKTRPITKAGALHTMK